jgi:hypothetical protein
VQGGVGGGVAAFQKRGRLRRTYQLDRSSMKVARRVATEGVEALERVGDGGHGASSSASIHRSSTWVGSGVVAVGSQPSRSA